ncbi:hypothetical protein QM012_003990 [Aureobasidium pullulans]|uniref:Uncharacterized protein n=1 Tax=Aureobasidium pullulans TaxID=5580 RepID=A0ABR0T6F8_AURPU
MPSIQKTLLLLAAFQAFTALAAPIPQLAGEGAACNSVLSSTDNGVGYGTENAEDNTASTISRVTRRQLAGEGAACDSILSDTDNGVGYGVENAEDNTASAISGSSSSTTTTGGSGGAANPPPPPPPAKGPKVKRQGDKIANGASDVLTAAKLDAVAGPVKTIGDNADGELTSAAANAGAQVGSEEEQTLENAGKMIPKVKRQGDKIANGASDILTAAKLDAVAGPEKTIGDSADGELTSAAANAGAQVGSEEEQTLENAGKMIPNDVRAAQSLPIAVNLAGVIKNHLDDFVNVVNQDSIIGAKPNEIYLAQRAPDSVSLQQTLGDIVAAHINHLAAHKQKLEHFPFGILAAHDRDWDIHRILLVYIDFEEPLEVTGFRALIEDVAIADNTLRDSDDEAQEVRDMYEMAQDVIFGARIDERTRLERKRFKLPPVLPRFKPDTPLPEDTTERAVAEHRMRQWLADERTRYFANPNAPLAPSATKKIVPERNVDPVVQVVQESGYDDFGYVVVRLDYSDEDAWTRYNTALHQYLDQSLEESEGGGSIADKFLIMNVEDEDLDGTGWHGAVSYYRDLCSDDMVPLGLQTNMILVADTRAMHSVLNPTPDIASWIWAVDVYFDWEIGDQPPSDPPPADRYPGCMRVALSVVLSEFWPLLKRPYFFGRRLWTPDLSVWEGIGV